VRVCDFVGDWDCERDRGVLAGHEAESNCEKLSDDVDIEKLNRE
jgi:hypothetical protein